MCQVCRRPHTMIGPADVDVASLRLPANSLLFNLEVGTTQWQQWLQRIHSGRPGKGRTKEDDVRAALQDAGVDAVHKKLRHSEKSSEAAVQTQCERLRALTSIEPGWRELHRDVKRLKAVILRDEERVDAVLLAAMLSERGYTVLVRCALGGTDSSQQPGSCFRNLRHEFVFVRCDSGEHQGLEILVDPNFREQFAIPQPTPAFSAILDCVPDVYVGTSARLLPTVELICTEMAASFEARGLTLPPWRRATAMLSKWMPAKAKDLSVDSAGASPRGPSPHAECNPWPAVAHSPEAPAVPAPASVTSPARRLRDAAQQLETLALHSQRQASPTHRHTHNQYPYAHNGAFNYNPPAPQMAPKQMATAKLTEATPFGDYPLILPPTCPVQPHVATATQPVQREPQPACVQSRLLVQPQNGDAVKSGVVGNGGYFPLGGGSGAMAGIRAGDLGVGEYMIDCVGAVVESGGVTEDRVRAASISPPHTPPARGEEPPMLGGRRASRSVSLLSVQLAGAGGPGSRTSDSSAAGGRPAPRSSDGLAGQNTGAAAAAAATQPAAPAAAAAVLPLSPLLPQWEGPVIHKVRYNQQ